jgi:hypothetical protein
MGLSLVLASLGCDKTDPPIPDDTNDLSVKPADMAKGAVDMATAGGDLATASGDMAMPTGDMAMPGPKVMGLPTCTDRGVTADTVFNSVAKASCAGGRCHGGTAGGLTFTDGASLKAVMVGKKSGQSTLDIVKAASVDQSYLIYKLMGQQTAPGVGGRGELMPKGGAKLPDADLCKFIVWVQEGAK